MTTATAVVVKRETDKSRTVEAEGDSGEERGKSSMEKNKPEMQKME